MGIQAITPWMIEGETSTWQRISLNKRKRVIRTDFWSLSVACFNRLRNNEGQWEVFLRSKGSFHQSFFLRQLWLMMRLLTTLSSCPPFSPPLSSPLCRGLTGKRFRRPLWVFDKVTQYIFSLHFHFYIVSFLKQTFDKNCFCLELTSSGYQDCKKSKWPCLYSIFLFLLPASSPLFPFFFPVTKLTKHAFSFWVSFE